MAVARNLLFRFE